MIEWVDPGADAIDEMRAVNAMVRDLMAGLPPVWEVDAEESRRARRDGEGWMGAIQYVDHATNRTVTTEHGELTLRTIVPDRPDAVYLHIHGGGWVLGAADQQDVLLATIAQRANVAVVSVEYRLAPEHPFPAGPDDCSAAAMWLIEHAADEFGTDRLLIGGESAGAHLSALTLLRVREQTGSVAPFAAANLTFGVFDVAQTPSCRNWDDDDQLVLSSATMRWFADCFVPDRSLEERRHPDVSPLYADVTDLVPALFTVGTSDPLIDDTLFLGTRWRAAGNPAEIVVFPEAPHGFIAFPCEIGRMGIERQVEFLARYAVA